MELEIEKHSFFDRFVIPHIALTTYKYRAKVAATFKKLKSNVTIDQALLLNGLILFENITQQELADMLYKDKSNLSRMIDGLAAKGLIKTSLDLKDNRAVKRLEITDKGRDLIKKIMPYAYKLHDIVFEGINKDEIEIVKKVMKQIRTNLNREVEL